MRGGWLRDRGGFLCAVGSVWTVHVGGAAPVLTAVSNLHLLASGLVGWVALLPIGIVDSVRVCPNRCLCPSLPWRSEELGEQHRAQRSSNNIGALFTLTFVLRTVETDRGRPHHICIFLLITLFLHGLLTSRRQILKLQLFLDAVPGRRAVAAGLETQTMYVEMQTSKRRAPWRKRRAQWRARRPRGRHSRRP